MNFNDILFERLEQVKPFGQKATCNEPTFRSKGTYAKNI
jgi:hypothetical protein